MTLMNCQFSLVEETGAPGGNHRPTASNNARQHLVILTQIDYFTIYFIFVTIFFVFSLTIIFQTESYQKIFTEDNINTLLNFFCFSVKSESVNV